MSDSTASQLSRRATIAVLGAQTVLSIVIFLDSFVNEVVAQSRPSIALGIALFATMTWLYLRGWNAATQVTVIAVTLLIGFAVPLPFDEPSLVIMLGPVLAMLITGPRWVVASAVLTLGLLIARSGGSGAYAETVNIVLYTMSVTGLVATQMVLESEVRAARQQTVRAERSEGRLRHFLKGAPVLIFTTDGRGICDFVGGHRLETGHTSFVGQSLRDETSEYGAVAPSVHAALEGKTGQKQLKLGERFLNLHYAPIGDGDALEGMIGVAVDVTGAVQAMDALRGSEERLAAMTERLPVLVLAVNTDGKIWRSDGLGLGTLGFRAGGLDGQSIFDSFVGDAARDLFRRALDGHSDSREVLHGRHRVELHCVAHARTPVRAEGVTVVGIVR